MMLLTENFHWMTLISEWESEVPGREQRLSVHQESGGANQRGGGASHALPGQEHGGPHSQGQSQALHGVAIP